MSERVEKIKRQYDTHFVNGPHKECGWWARCTMVRDLLAALAQAEEENKRLRETVTDVTSREVDMLMRNRALAEALAMAKSMILSRERMSETAAATIQAALLGVAALTEPTPPASESEGMLLRRLSDLLTGGNAGTWDEILHAATAQAKIKLAQPAEKSGRITMPHSALSST